MKIDDLNKSQRSSLYCNIDVLIRKTLGVVYAPYKEIHIQNIMEQLRQYYSKYNTHGFLNIWDDEGFQNIVRKVIVDMLENRCTHKQITYYNNLCERYNLENKGNMNRSKMAKRIKNILESKGYHQ